jgi:hypothetical protein
LINYIKATSEQSQAESSDVSISLARLIDRQKFNQNLITKEASLHVRRGISFIYSAPVTRRSIDKTRQKKSKTFARLGRRMKRNQPRN